MGAAVASWASLEILAFIGVLVVVAGYWIARSNNAAVNA